MVKCGYIDDIYVVELYGDIDHYTSEIIKREIYKNTNRYVKKMIIDLDNVQFMDSSGIGMILGRFREMDERNGRMVITGIKGNMERIFRLSGLYKIIKKYDTVNEALERWRESDE